MMAGDVVIMAAVRSAVIAFVTVATRKPSPTQVVDLLRTTTSTTMQAITNWVRSVLLLDMIAPNNKPLSECSRAECASFGGFYAAIDRRLALGRSSVRR
jgi:hypothetical protein